MGGGDGGGSREREQSLWGSDFTLRSWKKRGSRSLEVSGESVSRKKNGHAKWVRDKLGTCEEKKSQWLSCISAEVNNVRWGPRRRWGDVDHGKGFAFRLRATERHWRAFHRGGAWPDYTEVSWVFCGHERIRPGNSRKRKTRLETITSVRRNMMCI